MIIILFNKNSLKVILICLRYSISKPNRKVGFSKSTAKVRKKSYTRVHLYKNIDNQTGFTYLYRYNSGF